MPSTRTAVLVRRAVSVAATPPPAPGEAAPSGPRVAGEGVGSRVPVREILDGYLELDGHLVTELERAEETGVRGDAEVALPDRRRAPVAARFRAGDLEPDAAGDAA